MKRILSLALIFSMTLSFRAFCAPQIPRDEIPQGLSNGTATLIVELEAEPVLAQTAAPAAGYSLLQTDPESEISASQDEVLLQINEAISEDIAPGYTYSQLFSGFSIEAEISSIEEIKKLDGVKNVYISETFPAPELMTDEAGVITGAFNTHTTGYSGEGQVIAVIDGYLDREHEMFAESPENPKLSKEGISKILTDTPLSLGSLSAEEVYFSEKIPFAYNYPDKNSDTYNSSGKHGTHVSAIAAGKNGKLSDGTLFSGIAPEAQLIFMNVMYEDAAGKSVINSADVLAAIDDSAKLGADVINLSLGVDYANQVNSAESSAIAAARKAGIMVSCAAGNSGRGNENINLSPEFTDYFAMANPAVYTDAAAVASAYASGTAKDSAYPHSSSAWGIYDLNDLKPEITAPGVSIYSAIPDGYQSSSGTSMAAPHFSALYSLLNQYYSTEPFLPEYNGLTGIEKVSLLENLLMSSASIMRTSGDIPYSPRNQGAGLADISAAVKNPVVISGTNGDAKLSLGENLTNEINISFNIKNISKNAVTYDLVAFEAMTDGYTVESDGDYKISGMVSLDISANTFSGESVTIEPGEEYALSATLTLNSEQLSANKEIFTNGFFIDGYVSLKNTDADSAVPDISVPFFGFYGDWDDAPIFDSTMYDEGGSKILVSDILGTCLMLPLVEEGNFIIMGQNDYDNSVIDKKFIAYSNGESALFSVSPTVVLGTFRHFSALSVMLTDSSNQTVLEKNITASAKIYSTAAVTLAGTDELSELPDGEYTLTVTGTLARSDDEPDDSFSLPFAIDSTAPEIVAVNYDGEANTVTLSAKDNRYLQAIYLYYPDGTEEGYDASFSTDVTHEQGEIVTATFSLGNNPPDVSEIRVGCTDYALNDLDVSLASVIRTVEVMPGDFVADELGASYPFTFKNNTESEILARPVVCFYGADGSVMAIKPAEEDMLISASGEVSVEFILNTDLTTAKTAKLFIMESLEALRPVDFSYEIALK